HRATSDLSTLSLHDALPIYHRRPGAGAEDGPGGAADEELHPAREVSLQVRSRLGIRQRELPGGAAQGDGHRRLRGAAQGASGEADRKSTRLNSSHQIISYAV